MAECVFHPCIGSHARVHREAKRRLKQGKGMISIMNMADIKQSIYKELYQAHGPIATNELIEILESNHVTAASCEELLQQALAAIQQEIRSRNWTITSIGSFGFWMGWQSTGTYKDN